MARDDDGNGVPAVGRADGAGDAGESHGHWELDESDPEECSGAAAWPARTGSPYPSRREPRYHPPCTATEPFATSSWWRWRWWSRVTSPPPRGPRCRWLP